MLFRTYVHLQIDIRTNKLTNRYKKYQQNLIIHGIIFKTYITHSHEAPEK